MIVDISLYEKIFCEYKGLVVGVASLMGNTGDQLIQQSTYALLDFFGIDYRIIEFKYTFKPCPQVRIVTDIHDIDEILISGGGNIGSHHYIYPFLSRQQLAKLNKPVTVLPQSFIGFSEDISHYKKVYVREHMSLKYDDSLELAPDLALGYLPPVFDDGVEFEEGLFLREDSESLFNGHQHSMGDPAELSTTLLDYFMLASKFYHIITDRLHFCIAGILLGREVTLLPNSYFKNKAVYNSWLKGKCRFVEHVPKTSNHRDNVNEYLKSFTGI